MDRKTTALVFGTCHLAFMLVTVSQQQSFDPCLDNDLSKIFNERPFGPLRSQKPRGDFSHASNIPSEEVLNRGYLPSLTALTFPKKKSCATSNRTPPQSVPIRKTPFSDGNYAGPRITFVYRPAAKDVSSPRVNYSYPSRFAKIPSFTSKPFQTFSASLKPTLPTPFAAPTYLPPVGSFPKKQPLFPKKQPLFDYIKPKPSYRPSGAGVYVNEPIKAQYPLPQKNQQAPIPSLTFLPPQSNYTSISFPSRNISISSAPGTKNFYSFTSPEFRKPPSRHRVPPTYLPPFPITSTPVRYTYPAFTTRPPFYTPPTTPRPIYTTMTPARTYAYTTTPASTIRPTVYIPPSILTTSTTTRPPVITPPSVMSAPTLKTEGPLTGYSTERSQNKLVTGSGSIR